MISPASSVALRPRGVGWDVAAAFRVPALTAAQALERVAPTRGNELLVHGAGRVTGGMIVQLGVSRCLRVIAPAGPSSTARVIRYGAATVLDRRDPAWAHPCPPSLDRR